MKKGYYLLLLLIISFSSCIPKRDFYYFNKSSITKGKDSIFQNIKIQPTPEHLLAEGDVIDLRVDPVNFVSNRDLGARNSVAQNGLLIDNTGSINMPLVGRLNVKGRTMLFLRDTLLLIYKQFYTDPFVQVTLRSFKVTILGEVKNAGAVVIPGENVNIFEAIALAGDLTDEGKRANVKLIRRMEDNSIKEYQIDLSSITAFNSEAFFLKSNDIIYIPPVNIKRYLPRVNLITVALSTINITIAILSRF